MSDTKFTTGPWAVHPVRAVIVPSEHIKRPIGAHDDPNIDLRRYAQEICAMHWPDRNRSEQECLANANLMAAAPEMYEALQNFIHNSSAQTNLPSECEHAERILAKARGEQ